MNALYSTDEIRKAEAAALASLAPGTLMRRAGMRVADEAVSMLGASSKPVVLILAGPGNNGGDALGAAAILAAKGVDVTVLLYGDLSKQSRDAQAALQTAEQGGARIVFGSNLQIDSPRRDLIIDGLFGIGLRRSIPDDLRAMVESINLQSACPVLSIDVPSGLDADTGRIVGDNGIAVRADRTITFIGDKPGLHTACGRDHAGEVHVDSLDIDPALLPSPTAFMNGEGSFSGHLPVRRHNSHKGSYGDLAVIGGASGMSGAVILASRAAARCGAGRVFAGFLSEPPAYDSNAPELMCRAADNLDLAASTLLIGPGLGVSEQAQMLLARALASDNPIVLDADALNLLATSEALRSALAARRHPAILTPHPLEAARLLHTSAATVQADRPVAARELAAHFQAVVILKGSGSLIARPDGLVAINPTGNPGLSTAGTGDVLAGVCGALMAQQMPAWEAALAATWIHGRAADLLVAQGTGPIGLTAGELIPVIRSELNRLAAEKKGRTFSRRACPPQS